MLTAALILLILGAAVGIYLAAGHMTGKVPPISHALIHGPLGGTALVLLIIEFFRGTLPFPGHYAIAVITLGAVLGTMMFIGHKTGQSPPTGIILAHAALGTFAIYLIGRAAAYW